MCRSISPVCRRQRFVAFFVLDQVQDAGKEGTGKNVGAYPLRDDRRTMACPTITIKFESSPGMSETPLRTAYREHGLNGVLPVTVTSENFDKEGTLPVFILRVKDDSGNVSERKYKMNMPIVRRVLAPGEQKEAPRTAAKHRRR